MKIAVIVREETTDRCTGKGCLNAIYNKADAFKKFEDEELELIAFTHSGGDLEYKLRRMKETGVETIFLSTCMRASSPIYDELLNRLKEDFNVVGYTHGSEERKCKVCE